jgi:hypothetical protein
MSESARDRVLSIEGSVVKIRMNVEGGGTIAATLENGAAARDFASLLPLKLTLKDYEKVSDLPRRLNTEGAPPGVEPELGDVAYYSPWGNVALFYRGFGYSEGLVRLGRIESGVQFLENPGSLQVTVELANE